MVVNSERSELSQLVLADSTALVADSALVVCSGK